MVAGSTFPDLIVQERLHRAVMVRIAFHDEIIWVEENGVETEPVFLLFNAEGEKVFQVGDGRFFGPEAFIAALDDAGVEIPPIK